MRVILILSFLLNSVAAFSQTTSSAQKGIESNNQYYEADIDGLRKYIDDIKDENKSLATKMEPEIKKLENRRLWRNISWGVAGAGAALALVATAGVFGTKENYQGCPTCTPSETTKVNSTVIIAGGIMAVGGVVAGFILNPQKSDYLDFINKHNKLNKEKPLKWQSFIGPNEVQIGFNIGF